jgi:hypothetical protein
MERWPLIPRVDGYDEMKNTRRLFPLVINGVQRVPLPISSLFFFKPTGRRVFLVLKKIR